MLLAESKKFPEWLAPAIRDLFREVGVHDSLLDDMPVRAPPVNVPLWWTSGGYHQCDGNHPFQRTTMSLTKNK